MVETYLRHLDPVYLHGGIWAQTIADLTPEAPGVVEGLPKLPADLLDAPPFNPFGVAIDTAFYPETTWFVWFQTGWVPHKAFEREIRRVEETTVGEPRAQAPPNSALADLDDDLIVTVRAGGDLPEVALSWPPIEQQTYVAVDSRTGKILLSALSRRAEQRQDPHYDAALAATRDRAARWFRGGGSELGST